MAKKAKYVSKELVVDRILLVGMLCAATSYIIRGTMASTFFEAAAIVLGIVWSFRALNTNPSRQFRLLATLVLIMLGALVAFNLGAANGLL
ncbi:MAG TPA: hypothetical protein VMT30_04725 [Candidatus Saccharimonadia bacterium]|nr:hypothetical protein [Candidatus Saccharimonadia bacterium]